MRPRLLRPLTPIFDVDKREGAIIVGTTPPTAPIPTNLAWTEQTTGTDKTFQSIIWNATHSQFVAVVTTASATQLAATSPDAINWTIRNTPSSFAPNDVAWSPSLGLYAMCSGGGSTRMATSPDGVTWTARTAPSQQWSAITWSPDLGLFAAVGDGASGGVMTSSNGTTWTAQTPSTVGYWNDICWSPDLGLFAAVSRAGATRVMTSPDGVTWTGRTTPSASDWYGIAWSPALGLFAIVANGTIATSPDGTTWTAQTAPAGPVYFKVAWSPEFAMFLAVPYGGSAGSYPVNSQDGITWTYQSTGLPSDYQPMKTVCWSAELEMFVAATDNSGDAQRVMTAVGA